MFEPTAEKSRWIFKVHRDLNRLKSTGLRKTEREDSSYAFAGGSCNYETSPRLHSASFSTKLPSLIDFIERNFLFPSIMMPIQLDLPKNFL